MSATMLLLPSVASGFRECRNRPNQVAGERRVRRDRDSEPAAVGVVETVHAGEVQFATARVEAGHDQRRDPLTVRRADGVHVDDARHENLSTPLNRHVAGIGGGPSKVVERRTRNSVLLANAFRGQTPLTDEPPNRLDVEVQSSCDLIHRKQLFAWCDALHRLIVLYSSLTVKSIDYFEYYKSYIRNVRGDRLR